MGSAGENKLTLGERFFRRETQSEYELADTLVEERRRNEAHLAETQRRNE